MFNFLEYFYTEKYDDRPILKLFKGEITVLELKEKVLKRMSEIPSGVAFQLQADDNFKFLIDFFAGIFLKKEIVIYGGNLKKTELKSSAKNSTKILKCFPEINPHDIKIILSTSGSTGLAKQIQTTLGKLIQEAEITISEFENYFNKDFEFISSTALNHRYGLIFQVLMPLILQNKINLDKIEFPEDIKAKNTVFITTPSFLSGMKKYGAKIENLPEIIFSAGAKLEDEIYKYAESLAKTVIDIYGSTETGNIAYKTSCKSADFTLFSGILIQNDMISSSYSSENKLLDKIQVNGQKIRVLGRTDRLLKINEKRISADEIEHAISNNKFAKEAYLLEFEGKLCALVSLSENGIKEAVKNGLNSVSKSIKSRLMEKFITIPKKIKFIDNIPKNSLSKIDKNAVEEIFSLNLSLPLILKSRQEKDFAEFDLMFLKTSNFFKGHFDFSPICPGVVQLFFANYFAKRAFGRNFYAGQIKRLKFSKIIRPKNLVTLKLALMEDYLKFEYFIEGTAASSGSLPAVNRLIGEMI